MAPRKLKAWQFLEVIKSNPLWALQIPNNIQVLVEDFVVVENSQIEGIGPQITFGGLSSKDGSCAEFVNCPKLKIVEGRFLHPVKFKNCGLTSTEGIKIDPSTCQGFKYVAVFKDCEYLKEAKGRWCGAVSYEGSAIDKVENLIIENCNYEGEAACFNACPSLKTISGTFPGMISACYCDKLSDTSQTRVTSPNKNGTAAWFRSCTNLTKAEGNFNGFVDYKDCPIIEVNPNYLHIHKGNKEGMIASFWGCQSIKNATGEWVGAIDFSQSSIESTKGLKILNPNWKGVAAMFCSCLKLKVAEGTYHGMVDYSNSNINQFGKIHIVANQNQKVWANFENCKDLKTLPTSIPLEHIRAPQNLIDKAMVVKNIHKHLNANSQSPNKLENTLDII